jgi:hypothetical protein
MSGCNVELHIEELVLHGFAFADRYGIGEALQRELTRLLQQQGIGPVLLERRNVEMLAGGTFEVPPPSTAQAIGSGIANALHKGLR